MSKSILHRAPERTLVAATASTLGVLVMTAVHHIYGAALFDTPWRLHIVFISVPVALAILAAIPIARASPDGLLSRIASWVYLALGGVFAVGAIGVYEGGYNHLLPNLQYVLGMEHTLRGGLYVPPDDLVFQLTGIAQFAIAIIAARHLWQLVDASSADRLADPA
jgi:hypothetical protein